MDLMKKISCIRFHVLVMNMMLYFTLNMRKTSTLWKVILFPAFTGYRGGQERNKYEKRYLLVQRF